MTQAVQVNDGATRLLVLGLGCERGTAAAEVIGLAEEALRAAGQDRRPVLIASLDTRAGEPAMLAASRYFDAPFHTFDAARLEAETPRLANPSDIVFRHTGCHGVAEAAALAAAGAGARLVVPKVRSVHATAAIAESFQPIAKVPSDSESASLVAARSAVRAG